MVYTESIRGYPYMRKEQLGRIVAIRAEEDEEILKHFTPEQRRIRREWRNKQAMKVSEEDRDKFLEAMKQAFIDMAGGANG